MSSVSNPENALTKSAPPEQPPAVRARRTWPSIPVILSLLILGVVLVLIVGAEFIAPYDPNAQDLNAVLQGPGGAHLLGTDDIGRDILSRLIYGTRISVLAGLIATVVAVVIGLPLGVLTGYLGGWVDTVFMRFVDALLSFPNIVLSIAIVAIVGPGLVTSMATVGVVMSPTIARLARAQTLSVKEATYIEAARSFGARGLRAIILRHLLPNMIQPVIVQLSITMGAAMLAEASLSFLGLGVQAPTASWGSLLNRAYTFISVEPLQVFIPGVAIGLTVYAFVIVGDACQSLLDPKRRKAQ
ncbi:ABC transporter permease [Nocardia higoensis]|uniref:ABC transporter permease n=1 Tax=Nocardia higoensis TaxID=228599 RepID=UPI0002E8C1CF|nr:ABC transporter permease [Nocardia higoensis]